MSKNVLVAYYSKTGFTEEYARKIAAACGARALPVESLAKKDLEQADILLFGSRAFAGTLPKLKKMRALATRAGKKIDIVFATGAATADAKDAIQKLWEPNLTQEEMAAPHFYLPAGLCYEKMGAVDKTMMGTLRKMLRKKAPSDPEAAKMLEGIEKSFDISSDEYLAPLLSCLQDLEAMP